MIWSTAAVVLIVVGCAVVAITHPFGRTAAAGLHLPEGPSPTRSGLPTAAQSEGADPSAAFSAVLSTQDRRSLLLTSSELAAVGLSIDPAAPVTTLTPRAYAATYAHQSVSPAGCGEVKGLLVFADATSGAASIDRANDLELPGQPTRGSQQVRQFATEGDAIAFMEEQQAWFERCSHARFSDGASRIGFSGSVDLDAVPDTLLTTAQDTGAPWSTEFDGWVRSGTVVYAAYLLGDAAAGPSDLRSIGAALLAAASSKLEASG